MKPTGRRFSVQSRKVPARFARQNPDSAGTSTNARPPRGLKRRTGGSAEATAMGAEAVEHSRQAPADNEPQLIRAAQAGDRSAFAVLVEAYWERLYRWLFHLTHHRHQAEDLAQEAFLKAFAHLARFRPDTNFRAWLFRIAHNSFANSRRAGRR